MTTQYRAPMRTAPLLVVLCAFVALLCAAAFITVGAVINQATDSVDTLIAADAQQVADAAAGSSGYDRAITVKDAYTLLGSPLFADPSPERCDAALSGLKGGHLDAVIFDGGVPLCSISGRAGGPVSAGNLAWAEQWYRQVTDTGVYPIEGAERVGTAAYGRGPGTSMASAVPRGDLTAVYWVDLDAELTRLFDPLGPRVLVMAMLDPQGDIMAMYGENGPMDHPESFGPVDGSLVKGPGGVTAHWAQAPYRQGSGGVLVAVDAGTSQQLLDVFQSRSSLVATAIAAIGAVVAAALLAWGALSLRRLVRLTEAAAVGDTMAAKAPWWMPAEMARLATTLRNLGTRRRAYEVAQERARQDERSALGIALHDDVIQRLAAASLMAALKPDDTAATLSDSAQRIRNLSADLSSEALRTAGLGPALTELGGSDARLVIDNHLGSRRFPELVETSVHRNIVEVVHNAQVHGSAANITVAARVTSHDNGDWLEVDVSDDGVGIPDAVLAGRDGHFGIVSVVDLMMEIGGTATWERLTPHGTRVALRCPVSSASAEPPAEFAQEGAGAG